MNEVKNNILKSRNIKDISADTYCRNLNRLYKSFYEKELDNLDFLYNQKDVLEQIKKFKLSVQKNMLSAIVVALSCKEKHTELNSKYNIILDNVVQEYKNRPKEKITITIEQLYGCLKKLNDILEIYYSDEVVEINNLDRDILNRYLIGSLFIDFRAKHPKYYRYMEIISYDDFNKLNDSNKSYLVVINKYQKFFSFHIRGKRTDIKVNIKFNEVLNLYLKFHKKKTFIPFISKGNSASSIRNYINICFKKYNVTYNKLRKITANI